MIFFKRELTKKKSVPIKFVIVGIWNTIFGYLAFLLFDVSFSFLFKKRYPAYICAMFVAQIVSIVNAYIFHKYVTFKATAKNSKIISEFFRFSLTYVFIFCFNILFLPFFVEILAMKPNSAAAVLIFLSSIASYYGHSIFSFKKNMQSITIVNDSIKSQKD